MKKGVSFVGLMSIILPSLLGCNSISKEGIIEKCLSRIPLMADVLPVQKTTSKKSAYQDITNHSVEYDKFNNAIEYINMVYLFDELSNSARRLIKDNSINERFAEAQSENENKYRFYLYGEEEDDWLGAERFYIQYDKENDKANVSYYYAKFSEESKTINKVFNQQYFSYIEGESYTCSNIYSYIFQNDLYIGEKVYKQGTVDRTTKTYYSYCLNEEKPTFLALEIDTFKEIKTNKVIQEEARFKFIKINESNVCFYWTSLNGNNQMFFNDLWLFDLQIDEETNVITDGKPLFELSQRSEEEDPLFYYNLYKVTGWDKFEYDFSNHQFRITFPGGNNKTGNTYDNSTSYFVIEDEYYGKFSGFPTFKMQKPKSYDEIKSKMALEGLSINRDDDFSYALDIFNNHLKGYNFLGDEVETIDAKKAKEIVDNDVPNLDLSTIEAYCTFTE